MNFLRSFTTALLSLMISSTIVMAGPGTGNYFLDADELKRDEDFMNSLMTKKLGPAENEQLKSRLLKGLTKQIAIARSSQDSMETSISKMQNGITIGFNKALKDTRKVLDDKSRFNSAYKLAKVKNLTLSASEFRAHLEKSIAPGELKNLKNEIATEIRNAGSLANYLEGVKQMVQKDEMTIVQSKSGISRSVASVGERLGNIMAGALGLSFWVLLALGIFVSATFFWYLFIPAGGVFLALILWVSIGNH